MTNWKIWLIKSIFLIWKFAITMKLTNYYWRLCFYSSYLNLISKIIELKLITIQKHKEKIKIYL